MSTDVYASVVAMGNPRSLYATEERTDIELFVNEVVEKLKYFFRLDQQEAFEQSVRKEFKKIMQNPNLSNEQKLATMKNIVYTQLFPQISKMLRMEMNEQGVLQGDKSSATQKELKETIEALLYYNQKEKQAKEGIAKQQELNPRAVEEVFSMYSRQQQEALRRMAEESARRQIEMRFGAEEMKEEE